MPTLVVLAEEVVEEVARAVEEAVEEELEEGLEEGVEEGVEKEFEKEVKEELEEDFEEEFVCDRSALIEGVSVSTIIGALARRRRTQERVATKKAAGVNGK